MKKILTVAIAAALTFSVPAVSFADHQYITQKHAKAKIKKINQHMIGAMKFNAELLKKGYLGDDPYYARLKLRKLNEFARGWSEKGRDYVRNKCCSDTDRGPMGGVGGSNTGF
jgi:hypothetical protein